MINPFKEIDWNPDPAKRRSFAVSLIVGFPCLALLWVAIGWLRTGVVSVEGPAWLGAGAGAGVLFLAVPSIVRPFYVLWYFLAACIGIIVGNVLMVAVFIGVVTVVGMLVRAAGRLTIDTRVDRRRHHLRLLRPLALRHGDAPGYGVVMGVVSHQWCNGWRLGGKA